MYRASIYGLISLGVLHMLVLGADAIAAVPGWLHLDLWTFEHWGAAADQRQSLLLSGFAFWSTIGSFAVPVMTLGFLLLWLDRRGIAPPAFVGWTFLGWTAIATVLMLPSGFPVSVLVALGLVLGRPRTTKAGGEFSVPANPPSR